MKTSYTRYSNPSYTHRKTRTSVHSPAMYTNPNGEKVQVSLPVNQKPLTRKSSLKHVQTIVTKPAPPIYTNYLNPFKPAVF